ncbi:MULTISPECIES: SLAP domain-containing protein [Lactobacillus]|uniref:Cell division protein n=1 Tax=Lactobacillus xujianguonis TaxID=2495899 RepID=A0A437ST61_9LACO|nr:MULTISPECIES: SLAP domain-containing protein [Lactobacillus]RVU70085.1 cell division protein [Lactobacillus xujianguonis]RVU73719.1 cell division protein [Lactobacillus xujianguonis]
MKLSHKLVMVSAATLMAVSPILSANQNGATAIAATTKKSNAKKATTKKSSSKKTNGDVIVLGRNAYVYDKNGKRNKNYKVGKKVWPVIGKTAQLSAFGTTTINGALYFDIGNGNYIKAANVATVNGKKNKNAKPAKTTKPAASTSSSASDTTDVELTHNAYVYDKNGKRIKSAKTLKKGAKVSYYSTKKIKGKKYYYLGKGQYVKTANAKPVLTAEDEDADVSTAKVLHNAYVYDKKGKRIKTAKTLKKGAKVSYYSTKKIDGKKYIYLGKGQYVKASNLDVSDDTETAADETYITLVKNALVYDDQGNAYSPEQKLSRGGQYQALAAKQIDNKWYYQIGNDGSDTQWIKAVNAAVTQGPALIDDPSFKAPVLDNGINGSATDITIATLASDTNTFNSKGVENPLNNFKAGKTLRVSELVWLWVPSEKKAEQFYKLASDKDGYIKTSVVSTLDGKPLTAKNTETEVVQANTPATDAEKNALRSVVNNATTVRNSDAYKLAAMNARSTYDSAVAAGQKLLTDATASVAAVNKAASDINKAQASLGGSKVKVANINSLTADEQAAIIKAAAAANNVSESAVAINGTQITINGVAGTVTTLPISNYAE